MKTTYLKPSKFSETPTQVVNMHCRELGTFQMAVSNDFLQRTLQQHFAALKQTCVLSQSGCPGKTFQYVPLPLP